MGMRKLSIPACLLFWGLCTASGQSLTGIWTLTEPPECAANSGLYEAYQTHKANETFALQLLSDMTARAGMLKPGKDKINKAYKFLYKIENNTLFVLDPRLRLIMSSYTITEHSDLNLTLANRKESCEELSFNRNH